MTCRRCCQQSSRAEQGLQTDLVRFGLFLYHGMMLDDEAVMASCCHFRQAGCAAAWPLATAFRRSQAYTHLVLASTAVVVCAICRSSKLIQSASPCCSNVFQLGKRNVVASFWASSNKKMRSCESPTSSAACNATSRLFDCVIKRSLCEILR